jgi:hypothetical protein
MTPQARFLFAFLLTANTAFAASPQELLTAYEAKSAKAVPARGEQFFNAKHGKDWRSFKRSLPVAIQQDFLTQPK